MAPDMAIFYHTNVRSSNSLHGCVGPHRLAESSHMAVMLSRLDGQQDLFVC